MCFPTHTEQVDPYGVTVTAEGEDIAELTWYEPILEDGSTVIGYNVSIYELLQDSSSEYVDGFVTTETNITIENLQPFRNYSVSIGALTSTGMSEIPVTSVNISTTEAGKKDCFLPVVQAFSLLLYIKL